MKTFHATATLGELVRQVPARAQIFERLGMEYCCLGNSSLKDACRAKNMDLSTVESLLSCANASQDGAAIPPVTSARYWCEHIESRHHTYFANAIPQVRLLVKKAYPNPAECSRHAARLRISTLVLCAELSNQISYEQNKFFPLITEMRQSGGEACPSTVLDRQSRHLNTTAAAVRRIRTLTHEFTPPVRSSPAIFTLYAALWDLDRHTRQYVHHQQNILLPMLCPPPG